MVLASFAATWVVNSIGKTELRTMTRMKDGSWNCMGEGQKMTEVERETDCSAPYVLLQSA
jgi:hypothetical protein